jgi:integrase
VSKETAAERRFRFTDRTIDTLPPNSPDSPSTDMEYSDEEVPGLRLLVGKTGNKTFHLRYRIFGRKKCARIGPYPSVSTKDARLRAHELRGMIARDVDPLAERQARAAVPTFEDFALNSYLPHAKERKISWAEDGQKIRKMLLPAFGKRLLTDITARDVIAVQTKVKRAGAPATANRYLTLMTRMFNLAVQWGRLEKNPAASVRKFTENNARERYLKTDEISRMLETLAAWPNRSFAGLIRFLLFTGVRRGEAMGLTWDRVDLENRTIFLDKTKSGKTRTVLLNTLAVEVLGEMKTLRKRSHRFVFPGHRKDAPFVNPRRAFDDLCAKLKIKDFHIHDLRHSYSSLAVNAGVSLYDVQKLLGHSSSQMTQRYAHLADQTLRDATERVAASITGSAH